MKRRLISLCALAALALGLAGCVFAIGTGRSDREKALEDRVEELEHKLRKLEGDPGPRTTPR